MKLLPTRQRWLLALAAIAVAYLMLAYVLLPVLWTHHEHEPGLASMPMVTRTSAGIPGDALNVGLVGVKEDVLRAMHEAGAGCLPIRSRCARASRSSAAWCLTGHIMMRQSALFITTGKRNSLP